jgi:hypothetical protein
VTRKKKLLEKQKKGKAKVKLARPDADPADGVCFGAGGGQD